MTTLGWTTWQIDPAMLFGTAAMSNSQAQVGAKLEGRDADVFAVDSATLSSPLPDMGAGFLPNSITLLRGTIWIDRATDGLLKADLTFEADVRKPGNTSSVGHGKGILTILLHNIGTAKVQLPDRRTGLSGMERASADTECFRAFHSMGMEAAISIVE